MNIKGFRRMLFGEKMPDKNDPQYKERYERDVEAGRKFRPGNTYRQGGSQGAALRQHAPHAVSGDRLRIRAAALAWNIYRLAVVYRHQSGQRARRRRCRIRCCGSGTKPCKGTT